MIHLTTTAISRAFLQFLKYYARFAERDFFGKFDQEIQTVNQHNDAPMGIVELVKQHLVEEARQEGLEQGVEQGITQGEWLKAHQVALRIMEKHPEWSDAEVAEMVEMPLSFITQLREELHSEG